MLELLAPAGSMEALRAAVQNGADAVYLGSGAFNARMGAKNFTTDELREAVAYCHVRGAKLHLTLNTLASDKEMPQVAQLIRTAAAAGVDAFIVQDLGIVSLCRELAPQIQVHASTQMSIHSLAGVLQAAEMGCSRVVLARELPKQDIEYICKNSPVEIEVFVHGALCMCYSGQCYLSSVIGQRSGNRGQCAQPCRLPYGYSRFENNRFPLSLKDNCLVQHLYELQRMGVASIKIEGRAKRPEYVATVVRIYRSVLDGNPFTEQDAQDLEKIFSRQGFTDGYYAGKTGPKMFGTRLDTREDKFLLTSARASYESGERPRVPVRFYALIRKGEPVMLAAEDFDGNVGRASGDLPESAIYRPLTPDALAERLKKTGGTPYFMEECRSIIDPDVTVSAAALNSLRREVLTQLTALRSRPAQIELHHVPDTYRVANPTRPPLWTVSVLRADQITRALLDSRPAVLYVPVSELLANPDLTAYIPIETELCAVMPRVLRDSEASVMAVNLEKAAKLGVHSVLTGNLGQLRMLKDSGFSVRGDFGLNVYNSRTAHYFREQGLDSLLCSFEMTLPQIRDLSKAVPVEFLAYGRLPLMLTENCIIRNRTGACSCGSSTAKLVDRMGQEFPIVRDPGTCRSELLNGKKLWMLDKQEELKKLGLWALRLRFTTEDASDVNKTVAAAQRSIALDPVGCTRGLYMRGV